MLPSIIQGKPQRSNLCTLVGDTPTIQLNTKMVACLMYYHGSNPIEGLIPVQWMKCIFFPIHEDENRGYKTA